MDILHCKHCIVTLQWKEYRHTISTILMSTLIAISQLEILSHG